MTTMRAAVMREANKSLTLKRLSLDLLSLTTSWSKLRR